MIRYCGEASLVQVSLYFGQYISQFDARAIASPGVSQHLSESQLLLGDCQDVNAQVRFNYQLGYDCTPMPLTTATPAPSAHLAGCRAATQARHEPVLHEQHW